VHIETVEPIAAAEVERLLAKAPGVKVMKGQKYPTAVTDSAGTDPVFVGRIRDDISHPNGINLWVVSDNVRKGAALNSVQIAELLVAQELLTN
jgi:aspartate-semialdehyde dehydrogenase